MSIFNQKPTTTQRAQAYAAHPDATPSHEGGTLYRQNAETELYLQVCTMMFGDKYYEDGNTSLTRMRNLIRKCDRKFVLQLAAYARNEMKMRSAPQMLLAEASVLHNGNPNESKEDVRQYAPRIIRRADEPGEVLAYWMKCLGGGNKAKLPNALRKGIADALVQFDEYQFDKYNRDSAAVKLRDVIRLVHPSPANEERAGLYKRILDGTLAPTNTTWEKELSAAGQAGTSKKEAWNRVAPQMGLDALLKNIRNFEDQDATEALTVAFERFNNANLVQRSRTLPTQWYLAHKAAKAARVKDALSAGLELSLANLPKLSGNVAVVTDTSDSMTGPVSDNTVLTRLEVGALMSAMAVHLIQPGSEYRIGHFANTYEEINISARDSVLTNVNKVVAKRGCVGHGTEAHTILEDWIRHKKKVDHFLLFSDMQIHSRYQTFAALWDEYRRKVNPNAILYSFDLAGYGKGSLVPDAERGCYALAGFSEKVFSFMKAVQESGSAVNVIKSTY